jgi:hypothetical protein
MGGFGERLYLERIEGELIGGEGVFLNELKIKSHTYSKCKAAKVSS